MKYLINFISSQKNYFGIPESCNFFMEIHAPWRISHTGRAHFVLRLNNSCENFIYIKDHTPLSGAVQAPAENFLQEAEPLLPEMHGTFVLSEKIYSWSKKAEGASLFYLTKNNHTLQENEYLFCAAGEILRAQSNAITQQSITHDSFLNYIRSHTQAGIHDFLHACMMRLEVSDFPPLPCSWSHGDIWCKDIFLQNEKMTLIDWEWATETAPYGCDIIDLYITSAEHIYKIPTVAAWHALLTNALPPLRGVHSMLFNLWQKVGLDTAQQRAVMHYALLRTAGRAVAQEHMAAANFFSAYAQCLLSIKG